MYMSDICTLPANLAGLPAISIPCGLSEGLPVGFQLIGPAFSENRILQAAHALEGAIGFVTAPNLGDGGAGGSAAGGPQLRGDGEGWSPQPGGICAQAWKEAQS